MKSRSFLKWLGLLVLVLGVGAVVGGGLVYATTSPSQADAPAAASAAEALTNTAEDDAEPGIVIVKVEPDGPADKAGVERGDILLGIDDQAVNSTRQLEKYLSDLEPGDQVDLTVQHGDDERTLSAMLEEQHGRPYLGVVPCGGFPIAEFVIDWYETFGATIVHVSPDSPAADAGLQEGDRIVQVDGQGLDAENGLADLISAHEPGDTVILGIERRGEEALDVAVELGEHPENEGQAYLGVEYLAFPHLEGLGTDVWPFNGGPFGQLPFRSVPESGPFFLPPEGERVAGVVIRHVEEDSPAQEAGLRQSDVITAIDGEQVEGPQYLVEAIAEREPGDTITLTVLSDGEERDVQVRLGQHPEQDDQAYLGVTVGGFVRWRFEGEDIPFERLPFDLPHLDDMPFHIPFDELEGGALIRRVAEASPAENAGLVEGDIITRVDGEQVSNPQDLVDAVLERQPGEAVTLTVLSADEEDEREIKVTLAENPDEQGQAYLGVSVVGFLRSFHVEGREAHPWMQPLEGLLEELEGHFSFGQDGESWFEFRGRPGRLWERIPFDFDFDLPEELFEEAPCCTEDSAA
jgi:S1-C subfamily serine protease